MSSKSGVSGAAPRPASATAPAPAPPVARVAGDDFAARVRPILTARCQPCHFAGGKMYARLPFDRAETVLSLREKLFTRIKDEAERRPIREFLAAHAAAGGKASGTPGTS
ncbi:MAG TPA: hypothetical protein VIH93_02290 [Thermoanaerobaculia bacterium]